PKTWSLPTGDLPPDPSIRCARADAVGGRIAADQRDRKNPPAVADVRGACAAAASTGGQAAALVEEVAGERHGETRRHEEERGAARRRHADARQHDSAFAERRDQSGQRADAGGESTG